MLYLSSTSDVLVHRFMVNAAKEFGGNPRSHYERMIRFGLLTVNGQRISLDYKLKHADLLCNR